MITRNLLIALFAVFSVAGARAQEREPAAFTITGDEFSHLITLPSETAIDLKRNAYLHGGTVELNTLNGDMRFIRAQLLPFPEHFLIVMVNGTSSTQVFLLPKDKTKTLAYKGRHEKDAVIMEKCKTEDIVTE